jgi:2-polyprenyl-3-methyl-5-hydroxy-6-metoxy-1,4-benzoquinol methylase
VFGYRRCLACATVFIEQIPEDLDTYYAEAGYGSLEDTPDPRLLAGERFKLDLLRGVTGGSNMIEIGPGAGVFARVAVEAGFSLTAIEMDERYCRELGERLGVRALCSAEPASALQTLAPADAIVLWHSIEHLPDLAQVLAACVGNLQPGGVLAFSTPSPDALQFRLLGSRWAHLDAPRHLQLLPAGSMRRHLEALGMEHVVTVTDDPIGIACNRLGWEYAARLHPARHRSNMATDILTGSISATMTRATRPWEGRGLAGSTYTAVFRRPATEA